MSTADRLLEAAEELIARHGVDVSIRAINTHAGANAAAAHYHFGSKEDLVLAVLQRRMGALAEERRNLLELLEGSPTPSGRAVIAALVVPLRRLAADDGQHYVRFLAALRRAGDPWRALMAEAFQPAGGQWESLFDRAFAELPPEVRLFRRNAAIIVMLELLAEPGEPPAEDELVAILLGLLSAPLTQDP